MAKLPLETLKEDACLELGSWYLELGDEAEKDNKKWLYEQSQRSFDRYLSIHANNSDLGATRAKLSLSSLKAKLEKLAAGPAVVTPGPTNPGGPDKKAWPHDQPRTAKWLRLRSSYHDHVPRGTYYLAMHTDGRVYIDGKYGGKWSYARFKKRLTLQTKWATLMFHAQDGRYECFDYGCYLYTSSVEEVAKAVASPAEASPRSRSRGRGKGE